MRIFREGNPATFSCKCFIVRHLATQIAPWHFKESCPHTTKIWEVPVDTWWLAWWKPSTCLFFQWRSQSSSLCCTQLHLLCVFMWWTPCHHNLWAEALVQASCVDIDEIFCVWWSFSDYHRFVCAVWFRDEHHSTRMWGEFLHKSLVDMGFSCLRRGPIDDQCCMCTV